ncbi:MAG TPA: TIGR03435 family protein [Bryobacteraceae bacterium]|nr:TIGR03435 family protein [Bryobacteraceae bacterium]
MHTDEKKTSLVLLVVCACTLSAQAPSFEVVSVKPWSAPGGAPPRVKVMPTGAAPAISDRVHFIGQIELLIESAYGLPFSSETRIVGGPEWMRSEADRYEITATIDAARYAAMQKMTPAEQKEQVALMERSLLADRFGLRVHMETREMPRYGLVVAKGGSRMERAADGAESQLSFSRSAQGNEVRATAVSVAELAKSPFVRMDERQIVDQTGMEGRFNFTLRFRATDDDSGPSLPTALQEQLGLRLVPETGPVQVVVIDHIERPSGN